MIGYCSPKREVRRFFVHVVDFLRSAIAIPIGTAFLTSIAHRKVPLVFSLNWISFLRRSDSQVHQLYLAMRDLDVLVDVDQKGSKSSLALK